MTLPSKPMIRNARSVGLSVIEPPQFCQNILRVHFLSSLNTATEDKNARGIWRNNYAKDQPSMQNIIHNDCYLRVTSVYFLHSELFKRKREGVNVHVLI